MIDPALPSPTGKEVLELVYYHIKHMRAQEQAGLHDPENAGKVVELQRIADLVHKHASKRQGKAVGSAPGDLPGSLEEKMKLLKALELALTTVRPDGTTMAERLGDDTGVGDALRKSAALYKRLTADLQKQRKQEELVEEQLEAVCDMLLLWKMDNSTLLGPSGMA